MVWAFLWLACGAAELRTLSGIVIDPAGSGLEGAAIRVAGSSVLSASGGLFTLQLEPGRYELTVVAKGFKAAARIIDWNAEAASNLEIQLQLEDRREVVTVVDSAGYIAAASASLKAPTPLIDVPQAVTVVSGSQIRDQSMQNMADVVRYVPGITMAQGEGHRDAPVIRGNATTADFYVNGVRDDVQYMRDLYNVERVEAVKGANALTFGRGGGGGVINRVTKQAEFVPLREIVLQGGTFGNKRVAADGGYNFGERLAVRMNGVYEHSGSFRQDVRLERYGVAPAASLRIDDRTLARFGYEHFHDDRTVDRGIPSFAGRPSPAHRATFFGDPAASYAQAGVNLGSAVLERQQGRWLIRNSTLAGGYDKFYQNVFPGAVNAALTQVSISGYNNRTDRMNLFNQTDASGTVQTGRIRHTLLAGTEFGRQRTANFRNTAYFNGAASVNLPFWTPNAPLGAAFRQAASDADNGATNRVAAGFVQDQMELTRHVQVVAGVRYDYFDIDFRDHRANQRLSRADNLVAPRLGVVVKPAGNVSLYGSYSVAYLPGAGDQFASLTATTQTLRPERFNNYEMGAKVDLKKRLAFTTAFYRLDRNNSTARDPNDPARVVQTGRQRTNGFEAGLSGAVTNRWQIAGGYAAQDAFVSSATLAAMLRAKVALVPRHTFSLWNNYRILPRWSMGLGTIRQAAMWAGIDNTVRLPGFTRADLAAFFTLTETVRLQVNVENVFDANYYPTAHSNNNILPGSPRAARIGLVARF